MSPLDRPFLGRERELDALGSALAACSAGAGSVWLVSGEPGIGKSRLAEELSRSAERAGTLVLDGRCWEAGGAPAFWPWVQVLRGLARALGPESFESALGPRVVHLVPLVPELARTTPIVFPSPGLDAEQARFQVLEAVTALLVESAARGAPILVVLEDLHAADPSSLLLLEFLAREVGRSRLLVLGTHRDTDPELAAAAPQLARVARLAHSLRLARFDSQQTATLVERLSAGPLSHAVTAAVHAATDGNPLFVVEMARLVASDSAVAAALVGRGEISVPPTIRATLRDRIARLDDAASAILHAAAVVGRDFAPAAVAALVERDEVDVVRGLAHAVETALVARTAPEQYRFTHNLTREVLHDELPDSRRWVLHARRAEQLEASAAAASEPGWSEIAHHWLAAGPTERARAVAALARAAEQATQRMAFDDASLALERALACAEALGTGGAARSAELRLALARARNLAGDSAGAKEACWATVEAARRAHDGELLARAALEYGSGYVYGAVDAKLVALLEEALAALPAADGALRARLLARLGAALQPAPDPEVPLGLARDAVAMARRVGDARDLLATLRDAGSALMDSGPRVDRIALSREHVELAVSLGQAADAWRGSMRLVFDHLEGNEVAAATDAIAAVTRHAERLVHPYYRWPALALGAMMLTREGRFADAIAAAAQARAVARSARDPNAERSLAIQELCRLRLEGRRAEERAAARALAGRFAGVASGEIVARLWQFCASDPDEPEPFDVSGTVAESLAIHDTCHLQFLVEIAERRGDRALARAITTAFTSRRGSNVRWGLFGVMVEGPVSHWLGRAALVEGRADEALGLFEGALAEARASGARPYAAWIALDLGRELVARGDAADRERGRRLAEDALREAVNLAMPALELGARAVVVELAESEPGARQEQEAPPVRVSVSRPPRFSLERQGELWTVVHQSRQFHLADTKGLRILAALIAEPGRDWHVLDLVASEGGSQSAQPDVGGVLDGRARAEYRARIAALRGEIEEAERWNDGVRAERARNELEALMAELGRALGPRGRVRRQGSDAERARINVQRRVRDAIRRIGDLDALLARHLERSVRTGAVCRYDPE